MLCALNFVYGFVPLDHILLLFHIYNLIKLVSISVSHLLHTSLLHVRVFGSFY